MVSDENGNEIKDIGRLLKWMRLDKNRWKLRLQRTKITSQKVNRAIGRITSEIEIISTEFNREIESKVKQIPEWERWMKYVTGASANLFGQIYSFISWKKVKSCSSLPSYVGIGKEKGNKYVKSLTIQQVSLFCGYNSPTVKKLKMGIVRVKKSAYARFFQEELIRYSKKLVNGEERFKEFTPRNLVLYCLTNTAQLWLSHLTMTHFWLNHKILMLPYSVVHAGHEWLYLPPLDKKNSEIWVYELEQAIYEKGVKPVEMESEVLSPSEIEKALPEEYIKQLNS